MTKLTIGTTQSGTFSIEADAFATKAAAFIGIRGSGKTYGAMKIAESLYDAGKQFVAIDPVGVWWSLRLSAAKGVGLNVTIFGGLHGDVPLNKNGGALIADVIIDRSISAVIDVSQFETDTDKARFVTDFVDRFYFRKKSSAVKTPVHIFMEEAQEFVPQNMQRGEERMLHVSQRMIRLGRNFKIGVSMISQRPQDVNKKALNQAEWVFAFQLRGTQERRAVEDWIANNGIDEKLAQKLPGLPRGHAYVWSPSVNAIVAIGKKRTFDASADVSSEEAAEVEPKPLKSGDLEKLRESLAAIETEQKANDPKELKKQIAAKDREIAELKKAKPAPAAKDVKTKRVEISVLKDGQLKRAEAIAQKLKEIQDHGAKILGEITAAITKASAPSVPTPTRTGPIPTQSIPTSPGIVPKAPRSVPAATDGELWLRVSAAQQRVLDALAWYESIGNISPTGVQVGAIALVDASGGYFSNLVGPLTTHGLITRGSGMLSLTDKGRQFANIPERISSLNEYHEVLRRRVRAAKSANGRTVDMLNFIIQHGGDSVTTTEIGEAVGIDPTGGYFSNTIGPLSTLGMIRRTAGVVTPTDIIFPPGL